MNYRKLGRTGLEVSEIGFGAWGIGGGTANAPAYGPTDDQVSKLALRRAYDLGINFYDTSDFYGSGHSERLIGETFKHVRHEVVIATKVGFVTAAGAQDFTPGYIEKSLDGSLEKLQTDYVDLYYLHSPPVSLLEEDDRVISTLRALQEKGKVRALGISTRSPDDGLIAATKFSFDALEVNFNLADQRALGNGLLDLCQQENVGVIARTPLCFGFLTGAYSIDSEFDSGDHRSSWPSGQITRWANAHQVFSSALKEDCGHTPAQLALRFCISYPAVSSAIPGMLTQREVEENALASDLGRFPQVQLRKLEQVYKSNTFFVGKQ